MSGYSVAVVGAGAAGLLAAYQLLQLRTNVTIFEASDRAGGRLNTVYPIPGEPAAFELGAMRVPPCEQLFTYYTTQFGITPGGQFPDPGKVDTRVIFRNQAYDWPAGQNPPSIFDNVHSGWSALANKLAGINKLLVKPAPEKLARAQATWQALTYNAEGIGPEQGYSTISFYQGLLEAFVEKYSDYDLKVPWTGDDFELFAALGVGSGGFGSLYSVNLAEIARLIVNGLETNQQFYPGGMQQLVQSFLLSIPDGSRPALCLGDCIKYEHRVRGIEILLGSQGKTTVHTDAGSDHFDAAIVATTTRSMQVDMNLTEQAQTILPQPVSSAVRQLHLMNSSKLFVLTKTKFWQDPSKSLPSNIQADTLVRGLYCLDYYPSTPHKGYGVVLISYTWGDDSTKYLALRNPRDRLEACLRSLEYCAGDFVNALRPEILYDHIQMIDWQYEPNYFGAFKLNQPGQDQYNQRLYSHFLSGKSVFLAGDSVGWCGGWIESALQSGMNAACAVAQQLMGASMLFPNSPMTQKADLYDYGPNLSINSRIKR